MRLNPPKVLGFCFPLLLLIVSAGLASGGIRPSFALDYCAWHATHVVLVEVTTEDSVFSVVQSWKGDLRPGEGIIISELKPVLGAKPLSLYPTRMNFFAHDEAGISEQVPRQPVGSRMALFLKRGEGSEASPTSTNTNSVEKWRPADLLDEMKSSVVWIDGEEAYGFQQLVNPGSSKLFILHSSLQQMRERVAEINRIQNELAVVVNRGNSRLRA